MLSICSSIQASFLASSVFCTTILACAAQDHRIDMCFLALAPPRQRLHPFLENRQLANSFLAKESVGSQLPPRNKRDRLQGW